MSAIKYALRFAAGRIYDLRVLLIMGAIGFPAIWLAGYLGSGRVPRPESLLTYFGIVGGSLFILSFGMLAVELYRHGMSFRRYGELSEQEAADFHLEIANRWLERNNE